MDNKFQIFLRKNEKVIGSIASIMAIIMFVSLIEILMSNIRGDSNIFIQPLATAVCGFFGACMLMGKRICLYWLQTF